MNGIVQGTTCIVGDSSFNPDSSLGPTGTSAVVLAPSTNCETKFYAKGNNWVTGSKINRSAYHSELTGFIAAFAILDVLFRHHDRTSGSVTIALDGELALNQSGGDWSLNVGQLSFDYLQVIRGWINLSPLTFQFFSCQETPNGLMEI